jgi:hypothetical protein
VTTHRRSRATRHVAGSRDRPLAVATTVLVIVLVVSMVRLVLQ